MAKVTVALTNARFGINPSPAFTGWGHTPSTRPNLGSELGATGNDIYLGYIGFRNDGRVNIRLAHNTTESESVAGPRFSSEMEDKGLILVTASDGENLELTGISDPTEPYIWNPSNSSAVTDFLSHLTGLSDRSATVLFNDRAGLPIFLRQSDAYVERTGVVYRRESGVYVEKDATLYRRVSGAYVEA